MFETVPTGAWSSLESLLGVMLIFLIFKYAYMEGNSAAVCSSGGIGNWVVRLADYCLKPAMSKQSSMRGETGEEKQEKRCVGWCKLPSCLQGRLPGSLSPQGGLGWASDSGPPHTFGLC